MIAFVRLGLKIISATFGEDWAHFVGVAEKMQSFKMADTSIRLLSQFIMCQTRDVPRYHETKKSLNKGKQINSYWPIGQFWLPAATQDHMTPNSLDILRRGFLVIIPSLVLISQGFAEIWPNFLFGVFAADFDWLYRTNSFGNQKSLKKKLWGLLWRWCLPILEIFEKNWRGRSEKKFFLKIQNGGKSIEPDFDVIGYWTPVDPTVPHFFKLVIPFKSYIHIDPLVALECSNGRHETWWK